MPLSRAELQSLSLELGQYSLGLGDVLGTGPNSSTFAVKGDKKRVVKVMRSGGRAEAHKLRELEDLAPALLAEHKVGLLDVLVLERVVPGDAARENYEFQNRTTRQLRHMLAANEDHGDAQKRAVVDDLAQLTLVQRTELLSLFTRLTARGYVHFDPHLGNLGWTRSGRPLLVDVASCHPRLDMTAQDERWALGLQLALLLENTPPLDLDKTDFFQELVSIVQNQRSRRLNQKRFHLADLNLEASFGLNTASHAINWGVREAAKKAGLANPNLDIYAATLLLCTYLPLGRVARAQLPAPLLVEQIQRHEAVWLTQKVAELQLLSKQDP